MGPDPHLLRGALRFTGGHRDWEQHAGVLFDMVFGVLIQLPLLLPLFDYMFPPMCAEHPKLLNPSFSALETNAAAIAAMLASKEQFFSAGFVVFLQRYMPLLSAWRAGHAWRQRKLRGRRGGRRRRAAADAAVAPAAAAAAASAEMDTKEAAPSGGSAEEQERARVELMQRTMKEHLAAGKGGGGGGASVAPAPGDDEARAPSTVATAETVDGDGDADRRAMVVRLRPKVRRAELVASGLLAITGLVALVATIVAVTHKSECECDLRCPTTILPDEGGGSGDDNEKPCYTANEYHSDGTPFATPLFSSACGCMRYIGGCGGSMSWSCENEADQDPDSQTGDGDASANSNIGVNDERCDKCQTMSDASTVCDSDCGKRFDMDVLLSAAPFLIDVNLGGCDLSEDFDTLATELTQLRRLEVVGCSIETLPDLSAMENLIHLKICQNRISDIGSDVPNDGEGDGSDGFPVSLLSSRFKGIQLCKMGAFMCSNDADCPAPGDSGKCTDVGGCDSCNEQECATAEGTWTREDRYLQCDASTGHCLTGGTTRTCSNQCDKSCKNDGAQCTADSDCAQWQTGNTCTRDACRLNDNPVCRDDLLSEQQIDRYCTPVNYDCDMQQNVYGSPLMECQAEDNSEMGVEQDKSGGESGQLENNPATTQNNNNNNGGRVLQDVQGDQMSDRQDVCTGSDVSGESDESDQQGNNNQPQGNDNGSSCPSSQPCGGVTCGPPNCQCISDVCTNPGGRRRV